MNKILIACILIVALASCEASKLNTQHIRGRISMKGSTPNTYLALKDKNTGRDYRIINPSEFRLIQKQDSIVDVSATIAKKRIGPGFPAQIIVNKVYN